MSTAITVAYGDGIGPEIMEATLAILKEAKADLSIETIEIGKKVYEKGFNSGIPTSAWDSLKRTKVLLKAPITTPQGGGFKSLNVTIRKTLGLYANVRPCVSYYPFVNTGHPVLDLVIVRENEEDLYTGIEHRQTDEMYQCLKLISRTGCERIIRYAFEYAVLNNRKKVTCMSKDNIMKMSDGIFHKTFDEMAKEYPNIKVEHYIVDIGSARIATKPQLFDVVVTSNLYGDIISDIAAEVSGSVGLAGSANIGEEYAMFEAIHGSAPDISGKNIANPSGLLQAAVMMLVHIGQPKVATNIHNALLATIEHGIHTADIYNEDASQKKVGTKEFTEAVINHLGQKPSKLRPVEYTESKTLQKVSFKSHTPAKKDLVGVDVFIDNPPGDVEALGKKIKALEGDGLELKLIANKGLKVWPGETPGIRNSDHWRCCFMANKEGTAIKHEQIVKLLGKFQSAGIDFIKTENLYYFDGKAGFSQAQGE